MGRTNLAILNEANPNKVDPAFQAVNVGNVLGRIRTARVTVDTNVAVLPNGAKALALLGGHRTAGTATGAITPVGNGATLAAGQAQVNAAGDIAFFGTDAVTAAEITYLGHEGETVTATLNPSSGTATLSAPGAQVLAAATVAGVAQTIVARGTASPSAGEAALSDDGLTVEFNGTPAEVTVTYVPFPATTADEALRTEVEN